MREEAIVRDPAALERKLQQLKKGGKDKLHIVADFDLTLTAARSTEEGVRNSSWGALESTRFFAPAFIGEYRKLYMTYVPVIDDESSSLVERNRILHEWYEKGLEIVTTYGITKQQIRSVAESDVIAPRQGLAELFFIARACGVPFVVLSAGVGDFIEAFLRRHGALSNDVHIISNFYTYGPDGFVNGMANGTIHSLNKNEAHANHDVHAIAAGRPNVLLLGDHEHDIRMADGEKHDTVLSVGFLNGRHDQLELFENIFDVVIPEDTGLDMPLSILKNTCAIE